MSDRLYKIHEHCSIRYNALVSCIPYQTLFACLSIVQSLLVFIPLTAPFFYLPYNAGKGPVCIIDPHPPCVHSHWFDRETNKEVLCILLSACGQGVQILKDIILLREHKTLSFRNMMCVTYLSKQLDVSKSQGKTRFREMKASSISGR